MGLDLKTALRQMRRAPATALAAILTLAIGIGATTAVLSFVAAVYSAASPAPDMDRLVGVWSRDRGEAETKGLVSAADYQEWKARSKSFAALAAWRPATFTVTGPGAASRESAQLVTPEYIAVFGWRPIMGRTLTAEDAQPGAQNVILASHAFWRTRLGAREDIIGTTLYLDREPAIVIGVLPPVPSVTTFFVPLTLSELETDRSARSLFVFGRMREGVTIHRARAEMEQIGAALEREWPATNNGWAVNVRPLQEEFVGPQARLVFALLTAVVATVLVIGCVNIANLLLARGLARQGELAVRLALGAGGWRVIRQLLVECGVLALCGGALSFFVSRWALQVLVTLGAVDSPWIAEGGLNWRVMVVTAVVTFVATLAAGLAPALSARRANVVEGVRGAARSNVTGSRTTVRVLVGAQVTLAVTFLVVAGLASRTLIALESLDPGFDIDNLLTASVTLPDDMTTDAAAQFVVRLLPEAQRIPGVMNAGVTTRLPFAGTRWNPNRGVIIEGQPVVTDDEGRWAIDYAVTPGFLEALRVPLREGRMFTTSDAAGAPLVVIVSETMARRFWGDRSPLGARLRQGDEPEGVWRTVVGVVGDIRNDDADQPPAPYLYMPFAQQPARTMTIALRAASDPLALVEPLRQRVSAVDPNQALYDIRTMRQVWEADLQGTRVIIRIMSALALIALGLAGIGVWGVTAQAVGQRTREIGVRVALGATAADVGGLIAKQGLLPLIAGLVLGLGIGLGFGQLMRSILFQVTPTDPVTLTMTLGMLLAVGALATVGPAVRAARLDPATALRQD